MNRLWQPIGIFRCVMLLILGSPTVCAELPSFSSDEAADAWLREKSAFYKEMAESVDRCGGYRFRKLENFMAGAIRDSSGRFIGLNDALQGPERVSMIIFELTNHYQEPKDLEVDRDIVHHRVTDADHYAILREAIEYEGLHFHRRVLKELEQVTGHIPAEMLRFAGAPASLASYKVPQAYHVIRGSKISGHSKVFRDRFFRCLEELEARKK